MGNERAGYKRKTWNGTDTNGNRVPAGVYIYKLTARSMESDQIFTNSRKMVLMK
jgi:flagellar hook assembly protein FlgD